MPSVQEANKAIVRALYEHISSGDLDRVAAIVDRGFVNNEGAAGPAGLTRVVGALRQAFPDIRYTVEDLVAEGDRVVARTSWRGTHRGPFNGFPATGRAVANEGIFVFEVRDGKIVRQWMQTDRLGFLQAIGAVPPLPELAARAQAAQAARA